LLPGAVLHDPSVAANQALGLALGNITARDGTRLLMRVGTICIHGDNPAAAHLVRAVKDALEQAGFTIAAPER
jgi:UPF0271 protein